MICGVKQWLTLAPVFGCDRENIAKIMLIFPCMCCVVIKFVCANTIVLFNLGEWWFLKYSPLHHMREYSAINFDFREELLNSPQLITQIFYQ